mmetsp:Transcript_23532/g.58114  ORF Transcript_23532/g.58114 Transcript_23532/m.58114 type:complete len:80 (+) Transcript_23532:85-324(+)
MSLKGQPGQITTALLLLLLLLLRLLLLQSARVAAEIMRLHLEFVSDLQTRQGTMSERALSATTWEGVCVAAGCCESNLR